MNKLYFAASCGLLCMGTLSAQEVSRFTFELGTGFTQPVGTTSRYTDTGWNLRAGVGYNFSNYIGAMVQAEYDSLGVNSTSLGSLGYGGGSVNIFSATVDPIVHLTPKSHFDLYAIGGGGMYRWSENFSSATTTGTAFDNGSFPLSVPASGSSYSLVKPGANIGMGVAMGTKWHGKVFAEARYVHIFMENGAHTDYIPVTFGFRF